MSYITNSKCCDSPDKKIITSRSFCSEVYCKSCESSRLFDNITHAMYDFDEYM